jgi:hypothetical protein
MRYAGSIHLASVELLAEGWCSGYGFR